MPEFIGIGLVKYTTASEILSRLNPKTQGLEMRVQGLQGGISGHDIAMAMRGSSYIDEAIARLKFAGQTEYTDKVIRWLELIAQKMSRNWRKKQKGQEYLIAILVYNEHIVNPVCQICNGRRQGPNKHGLIQDCPKCLGTGRRAFGSKDKAEYLGVDESSYRKVWKDRIRDVSDVYLRRESAIVNRIAQYMK